MSSDFHRIFSHSTDLGGEWDTPSFPPPTHPPFLTPPFPSRPSHSHARASLPTTTQTTTSVTTTRAIPEDATTTTATTTTTTTLFSLSVATVAPMVLPIAHTALSLGALYAMDLGLKSLFLAQGISFPAPLAGMFIIIASMLSLPTVVALPVLEVFRPALVFLARWLPLFYVPTMVMAPLAIATIPSAALVKISVLLVTGMVATLLVTAQVAVVARQLMQTVTIELPLEPAAPGPGPKHRFAWLVLLTTSYLALKFGLGPLPSPLPSTELVFMLSATVMGHLAGNAAPPSFKRVVHPILSTALAGLGGAFALGYATNRPWDVALRGYLTKGAGGAALGAGDLLMSFLGCVILSFGFRIYEQRAIMKRHFGEIMSSCLASAAFGLFVTAGLGKAIGLSPSLVLALVPRSITVALALPIAGQLGVADTSITATAVVLTGLLGANFAQTLLDKAGFRDPIVRGMATAGSSHGLGTAALAAREPEALPYCALAYATIGILSTLLVACPPVRALLLLAVGV